MRCVNCGFDNEPGRQVCVKCGTPLSSDDYMGSDQRYDSFRGASDAKQTVVFSDDRPGVGGPQLKQTIVQMSDGTPEGGRAFTPKATVVQGVSDRCPRCNYPMMGNYCSNCGYEVPGAEPAPEKDDDISQNILEKVKSRTNRCVKCNAEVSGEFHYCPHCGTLIPQPTINIFDRPSDEVAVEEEVPVPNRFSLIPVVGSGQPEPEALQFEFIDGSLILNRDNTAPGNRTITSKEQAEVRCEEGKWILENRSEYDSTFVAATRPIELQPGDIILMGDQRFRFEPAEEEN